MLKDEKTIPGGVVYRRAGPEKEGSMAEFVLYGSDESDAENYQSFVLRMWRSQSENQWRVSLQSVNTGEHHTFADMDHMWRFLQQNYVVTARQ